RSLQGAARRKETRRICSTGFRLFVRGIRSRALLLHLFRSLGVENDHATWRVRIDELARLQDNGALGSLALLGRWRVNALRDGLFGSLSTVPKDRFDVLLLHLFSAFDLEARKRPRLHLVRLDRKFTGPRRRWFVDGLPSRHTRNPGER